ncbi:hypothetical protein PRZ48_007001 [Zasmidium cellare]|uniref:F-box domain-containing protein n=1 Tax=Zasmidium cellare TaxID=395010 RepID=A0ABR0EII5_ZASCE|nr:hypothetical protein PRZ48_007001 [Zasmidium cellare]
METPQPNPPTAPPDSPPPPQTFDACDRFFSIDELLTLFLESSPPLVLLNCTRVCTKWNSIIIDSPLLQQNLFLEQVESEQDDATSEQDSTPPRLNPILWQVFGPILATETEPHHSAPETTYEDLESLPWARDGTTLSARARTAFAREEASWRNMYISQPPLSRLDWWHTWTVLQPSLTPRARGWGHQDLPSTPLTLGLLWDLLESRLFRGCSARISYFVQGMDPAEDETAGKMEKFWRRRGNARVHEFDGAGEDPDASGVE